MITDIVPATPEHAAIIAANVRPEDKAELWASSLTTPARAMGLGLQYSDKAFTGMVNGEPICMWGVVSQSMVDNDGVPWMIGSNLLDVHAKVFLRRCRRPLLELLNGYDRLENYVDARNERSIQWLRFMGFTVADQTQEYGALKLPFYKFWREASNV